MRPITVLTHPPEWSTIRADRPPSTVEIALNDAATVAGCSGQRCGILGAAVDPARGTVTFQHLDARHPTGAPHELTLELATLARTPFGRLTARIYEWLSYVHLLEGN